MPFTPDEEELYLWLRSSLPRWFFQSDDAAEEIWGATVKGLQPLREQMDSWVDATYILNAETIWLNAHARDRGTFRQSSETDATLRERLRSIEDAITPPVIAIAVNKVLLEDGLQSLIEVPTAGWRMQWAIENSCSGEVTITAGFYTLVEIMTEMQTQFLNPATSTTNERLLITASSAGIVEIEGTTGTDQFALTWVDTDFRDALGFAGNVSNVYTATGATQADGSEPCHIVELRRDRAFMQVYTPPGGTGDTYTKALDVTTLLDAAQAFNGCQLPVRRAYYWIEPHRARVVLTAGSTTSANNVTAASIIAIDDTEISYINPDGVTEAHPGTWQMDSALDNRRKAYLSRGYRMTKQFTTNEAEIDPPVNGIYPASGPPAAPGAYRGAASFIVILPYGTTAATALGVQEALRQKKAGGIMTIVERRASP